MKIYLDDIRQTPDGFVRVFSVHECILALKLARVMNMNLNDECDVEVLSLDNDLGNFAFNPETGKNEDGYLVLDWLEEQHISVNFPLPKEVIIHSANPVARDRCKNILRKYYTPVCGSSLVWKIK